MKYYKIVIISLLLFIIVLLTSIAKMIYNVAIYLGISF